MVKTNKRRAHLRRQRAWAVTTGGALLAIWLISAQHHAAPTFGKNNPRQAKTARVAVMPVVWHMQTASEGVQTTPALNIDVDVSHTQSADLNALKEALAGVISLPEAIRAETRQAGRKTPERTAEGSGKPSEADAESEKVPVWFAWGHLNVERAPAQVTAPTSQSNVNAAEALGVYAVRDENGATVCLVNKTNARLLTNTRVRLPRGVYRIERLTISKETEKTEETPAAYRAQGGGQEPSEIQNPKSNLASLPPVERLERLEGCDLSSVANVKKGLCLEPGQVCLYRYTDVARAARASWMDVFAQLRDMGRNHPGPARRLGTMLHEADGYVAGVRGGGDLPNRLGCVHHLLLVVAQAHSLHHNYQMRHTVNEANGKAVIAALDRLTDSLSETSATLLGLVPQVAVTSPPALPSKGIDRENGVGKTATAIAFLVARQKQKEENTAGVENGKETRTRTVTIALANTGSRSISKVKIGLNAADLPAAVTCDPADPAYFGDLRPGQTIRATFRVRGAQDLPNALLTGDVSYFAGTAPAHLRPRAW